MTRLQRAQLKQSELRSKLAAELDKDESNHEELDRITKEVQGVEVEIRAAMVCLLYTSPSPRDS